MHGGRWHTLLLLIGWIAVVSGFGTTLFGILYWGAEAAASAFGNDLKSIAADPAGVRDAVFGIANTFFTSDCDGRPGGDFL